MNDELEGIQGKDVELTFLMVDISGSTGMKEERPEVEWVNTTTIFYKIVSDIIIESEGKVVKFVGDGVLAELMPTMQYLQLIQP